MKILARKNLSALGFLGSILVGIIAVFFVQSQFRENRFNLTSENLNLEGRNHYLRVSSSIDQKKAKLATIVKFFAASNFISADEFKTFVTPDDLSLDSQTYCWTSTKTEAKYSVGSRGKLCENFDFLEPNKIIDADRIMIMFSTYAKSLGEQEGFVSAIYPLDSHLSKSNTPELQEIISIHNIDTNKIRDFRIDGTSLIETFEGWDNFFVQSNRYPLESFSGFNLFHVVGHNLKYENISLTGDEKLICLLIFIVSIILGLYIQILVLQKYQIKKTVETRTRELKDLNTLLEKEKETALLATEQKSMFLANMSHELRTPLNGIVGTAELLSDEIKNPSNIKLVNILIDSCKLLQSVISNILDFSKMEAGQFAIENRAFDIHETLRSMQELNVQLASHKGLDLQLTIDDNVPMYIVSDETRIKQIISNLLSNALKFTKKGTVKASASYDNQNEVLRLEVSDTGIGIDEKKIQHVFGSFAQEDASTTRRFGGTGLGLAIVRNLSQSLGGDVNVESRIGQGSKFTVVVKAQKAVEVDLKETHQKHRDTIKTTSSNTILVVEDNDINKLVLERHLKKLGYDCVIAENGKEALSILQQSHFEIVLMDCHMPVMDGFEATREIRKHAHIYGTPLVYAITASVMDEDIKRALEAGMDDVVAKPIKREHLREILARPVKHSA